MLLASAVPLKEGEAEPNVEEISQVGIEEIVAKRRISYHKIIGFTPAIFEIGRGSAEELLPRH